MICPPVLGPEGTRSARALVQVLPAGDSFISQAQSAIQQLMRLSNLDPGWDRDRCAVLAYRWQTLDPARHLPTGGDSPSALPGGLFLHLAVQGDPGPAGLAARAGSAPDDH